MRPDILAEHLATTIRGLVAPLSTIVTTTTGDLSNLTKTVGLQYAGLLETVDNLSARLSAVESREPLPGPPGPQGEPGPAGKDGSPGLRYCGVYVRGKTYDQGDLVTAGGSAWYCRTTTTLAPGNSGDWSLMVQRGRDARDRKAAT